MMPDILTPDREKRLAALEQVRALSERLRAARVAQDVDAVALLRQIREERVEELLSVAPATDWESAAHRRG